MVADWVLHAGFRHDRHLQPAHRVVQDFRERLPQGDFRLLHRGVRPYVDPGDQKFLLDHETRVHVLLGPHDVAAPVLAGAVKHVDDALRRHQRQGVLAPVHLLLPPLPRERLARREGVPRQLDPPATNGGKTHLVPDVGVDGLEGGTRSRGGRGSVPDELIQVNVRELATVGHVLEQGGGLLASGAAPASEGKSSLTGPRAAGVRVGIRRLQCWLVFL